MFSAIARRVGIDRKTVRKYIERGLEPPAYGPRKPRPRRIAPFEAYLRQQVIAGSDREPACCARSASTAMAVATPR
jgi:transposase